MRYESSSARTPPPSGRRMMPPAPLQTSHALYEERQLQIEVPGRVIFETFSSEGPSQFLVVSRARWDEHQWKMSGQKEELRRTPITLQENSFSSMSERLWQAELDEQRDGWSHFWKNG